MKLLHTFFNKKQHQTKQNTKHQTKVSSILSKNQSHIDSIFNHTDDVTSKKINFLEKTGVMFYIHSLVHQFDIAERIIEPLSSAEENQLEQVLSFVSIEKTDFMDEVIDLMLEGKCVIFLESSSEAYIISVSELLGREVSPSEAEQVVIGSHISYVEIISRNLSLIRNSLKNPDLSVKNHHCGTRTKNKLALLYMNNMADDKMIKKIQSKIRNINIDALEGLGELQKLLEDIPFTPFPQFLWTERVDKTASLLLKGRAALLVDGYPGALILPATFFDFFQASDDFNSRWLVSLFYPFIRIFAMAASILLPAYYISVVSFNFDTISLDLILPIQDALQTVPFTPFVEAIFMSLTLELLRESAVRLPRPIAETVGIVGGLIIGDAIVDAGLVSNFMIIIIALTGIATFVGPYNEMRVTIRLISFPMMAAASLLGLTGMTFGIVFVMIHLCTLQSYGKPYFSFDHLIGISTKT
ncbi:spore germination protein [Chengkuizengella axinellae]|uniref:Spore germination protein n=1 Tax=Chengkuizengella axinellae TaxID=3064388 RepID=A0ABT9J3W5_9BACL|nr:spore germination protein [Chengkuizengella sp. 2205SS18-9]MDP5276325.1 spore germination protein [Chengkuizengella sp. 2205SS18-9]